VEANLHGTKSKTMIGKIVAHYRIIKEIGHGGMGIVYQAEDTKLKRTVALKFLPSELTQDAEAKQRFLHEARAAAAISHASIVTVHEINEHEGRVYIAMEYVEGRTLKELIAVNRPPSTVNHIPIPEVLDIAMQIASGLTAAHAKGIVHRDIKPANVMLTDEGIVKIVDFGLAKLKGLTRLTKSGTTLGTVAYMSPEQATGKDVDHRTDIWSLGVVLYEMLIGTLPFKGDYEQAVVYSILNEEPAPITSSPRSPSIPLRLTSLINKALAKNPRDRYGSVSQMLDDLHAIWNEMGKADGKGKKPIRRWLIPMACGLAVLAVLLLLKPKATKESAVKISSIAVLPLQNYSQDPEQDYFADGMTEALISELSRIRTLRVISRTSAMLYKKSAKPLPEIARELHVDAVLEGSALRAGHRIRITAQLIEARSDRHIWADDYERDYSDVLSLQKEVSSAIAREIRVALTPEEATRLSIARKVNVEAHEAYLKGLYLINKFNEEDTKKGIAHFEEALGKDPDYALAYTGLAMAYDTLIDLNIVHPREIIKKMKADTLKALSIDESLGEAHLMLAEVKLLDEWDFKGAEREFKLALQLNPSYSTTYLWYANFLHSMGRNEEAYALIQRARQIDPMSMLVNSFLGFHFVRIRQYDKAIVQIKEVLDMEPNDLYPHYVLGNAYIGKKMMPEAIAEFQKAAAGGGLEPAHVNEARAWALNGKPDMAKRMLADLLDKSQTSHVSPRLLFYLYYSLGETDKALAWLERSAKERELAILFVQSSPFTEQLHQDPRFAALLKKLGLKE